MSKPNPPAAPVAVPKPEEKPKAVFSSGASSRSKARDYTLLVPESLNGIVDRHQFGIEQGHARGNWQSGRNDADFVRDRMNHFFEHAIAIITGEHPRDGRRAKPEDLDAALCNLQMLVWYRKHGTGLPSVAPYLVTPGEQK